MSCDHARVPFVLCVFFFLCPISKLQPRRSSDILLIENEYHWTVSLHSMSQSMTVIWYIVVFFSNLYFFHYFFLCRLVYLLGYNLLFICCFWHSFIWKRIDWFGSRSLRQFRQVKGWKLQLMVKQKAVVIRLIGALLVKL